MLEISSASKEYIRIPISATESGAAVDPTGNTVEMAFIADDGTQPVSADWKTASWETVDSDLYYARCVVGPGGAVELAAGIYRPFVRVTSSPEVPVLKAKDNIRVL